MTPQIECNTIRLGRMRSIYVLFLGLLLQGLWMDAALGHSGNAIESVSTSDTLQLDPKDVMLKSLMLPGWGQFQNEQRWKIPVIYGAFVGAGFYLSDLTKRYHDYRAAVYNTSRGEESDFRFGQTPSYIPSNANITELQRLRDSYRNKRDFAFLVFGMLYGLNVLDAYVYAHMSSFDVSDDLRASISIAPMTHQGVERASLNASRITPGIRVQISLR